MTNPGLLLPLHHRKSALCRWNSQLNSDFTGGLLLPLPPQERTPELKEAIQLSDLLLDEFLAADLYVFGVPMFNFSVPSTFKAYIDQIGRIGRNFAVDEQGFKGLVEGNKKVLVITACGGSFQPGTPTASYDFQEPYLRSILGFIGITDIKLIHADNLSSTREQSLANARESVQAVWTDW